MLVLSDANSKKEDDVYGGLAASYRDIAARLREAADRMSAQSELPMGTHDEGKWTDAHIKAFARFVQSKSRSLRCCALRQGATSRCSHRWERSLSEVSLSRRSRRSHPSSDDASLQDIELANTVILPVGSTAPPAMLQSGTVSASRTVR